MAQNRPTERGLSADHIVNRTSTDTCHELVDLFLVIILHEKRHCVVQSNLILAGGIRDHNRILEQILQIADSALILILFAFCRMVLKIFTQIAVGTRFLDRLNQFRSLLKFSLVNLLLNFLYVVLCQFLSHFPPDPYLFSSSRLFIASLMHPMIVVETCRNDVIVDVSQLFRLNISVQLFEHLLANHREELFLVHNTTT